MGQVRKGTQLVHPHAKGGARIARVMKGERQLWPPEPQFVGVLWTPADDPGVAAWWDPSDAASFTVTPEGGVAQWQSKGVTPRVLAQAVASSQPVRVAGRPWVDFTNRGSLVYQGADSGIAVGELVFLSYTRSSVQTVMFNTIAAGFAQSFDSAGSRVRLFTQVNDDLSRFNADWREQGNDPVVPPFAGEPATGIWRPQADSVKARIAGYRLASIPNTPWANPFSLGNAGAESVLIGDVIVLAADSPLDLIRRVEGYLAHNSDCAGDLPADHPYRSTPPMATVPAAAQAAAEPTVQQQLASLRRRENGRFVANDPSTAVNEAWIDGVPPG